MSDNVPEPQETIVESLPYQPTSDGGTDNLPSPSDSTGEDGKKSGPKTGRQMRQEGQRNLQDSTFSISEELEPSGVKTSVRVRQPPGGVSSGGFW